MKGILTVLAIFIGLSLQAQKPRDRETQEILLKAQLYEITAKLRLSRSEEMRFTELYTQYFWALRKAEVKPRRPAGKPTEAEAERIIKEDFAQPRRMLAIREAYYEKFKAFLSQDQILQMFDTERDISRKIIRESESRRRTNDD
jgi:hypothetical protein